MLRERYVNCGLQPRNGRLARGTEQMALSETGRAAEVGRHGGWHNTPKSQHAKESLAARVAAIGGKLQPSLGANQRAVVHALAGNAFEVEVPAPGAVRETSEGDCDSPCVEPAIAGVASPGFQVSHRKQKIQCTVAVRTKTVCAAALGTYHLFSRGPPERCDRRKNTENPSVRQAGGLQCRARLQCRISSERNCHAILQRRAFEVRHRCQATEA
jgi:hypothetical protein